MRKVMRWRYSCDFCKKSGCSGGSMAKHERHCCSNPARVCRMCIAGGIGDEQRPMDDLIAALHISLDALKDLAQHCPACILAAIIVDRRRRGITNKSHDEDFVQFDYTAAVQEFWSELDSQRAEEASWR